MPQTSWFPWSWPDVLGLACLALALFLFGWGTLGGDLSASLVFSLFFPAVAFLLGSLLTYRQHRPSFWAARLHQPFGKLLAVLCGGIGLLVLLLLAYPASPFWPRVALAAAFVLGFCGAVLLAPGGRFGYPARPVHAGE